jgi:tRNA nucleotidyltransferase (CCA-adding enzyme)
MKTYIVGGAVRDFLLGRPVKDLDYVVTGATPQEMLDAGFKQVGADFPVFLHPDTNDEYALARIERKTAAGYHGFDVNFDPTVTIEDDLSRRDLTMNAMAVAVDDWWDYRMKLDHQLLVDPFNGYTDLMDSRLHVVSDAFAEDPVRILRTARFQARYGFGQSRETTVAVMAMVKAGEVDALVPERVWTETWKAVGEKRDPLDFFFFLEFHDCRKKLFKQLNLTDALIHHFDGVKDMSTKQRMAMLTVGFKNVDQVGSFFDKLKAPTDVKQFAQTVHRLAALANLPQEKFTAEAVVDTLAKVHVDDVHYARDVLDGMHKDYVGEDFAFQSGFACHMLVDFAGFGFKDLTAEQQATLKGKAIGDALRDLKVAHAQENLDAC